MEYDALVTGVRVYLPALVLGYFLLLSVVMRRMPVPWQKHLEGLPMSMFGLSLIHLFAVTVAYPTFSANPSSMLILALFELIMIIVLVALALGTLAAAVSQRLEYGWPDLLLKLGIALAAILATVSLF